MKTSKNTLLFNCSEFDIKLDTEWIGRNFILFDEIDSTNTYLLSDAAEGLVNGSVVLAEKQFQGKGRMNRTWYSGKGLDLTFSILLNDKRSLKVSLPAINLGTATAIAQSVSGMYQVHPVLKWPNDVILSEKKFAGVLLETSFSGKKLQRLVVGAGINVNQNNFQGEYRLPPTSLALEVGEHVERERLMAVLLNSFEEMFETALQNPTTVFNEWRSKCSMIGDKVTLRQEEKLIDGVFEDIDTNGNMLLNVNGRLHTIHSGEIVF